MHFTLLDTLMEPMVTIPTGLTIGMLMKVVVVVFFGDDPPMVVVAIDAAIVIRSSTPRGIECH
jgi:hypothetical protein